MAIILKSGRNRKSVVNSLFQQKALFLCQWNKSEYTVRTWYEPISAVTRWSTQFLPVFINTQSSFSYCINHNPSPLLMMLLSDNDRKKCLMSVQWRLGFDLACHFSKPCSHVDIKRWVANYEIMLLETKQKHGYWSGCFKSTTRHSAQHDNINTITKRCQHSSRLRW